MDERLQEPGGVCQHPPIRGKLLVVPRHAREPVSHAGAACGGADDRFVVYISLFYKSARKTAPPVLLPFPAIRVWETARRKDLRSGPRTCACARRERPAHRCTRRLQAGADSLAPCAAFCREPCRGMRP